ncbi:zinc-binding dehydrogenase [Xylariaceae sp. FL0255]|nr:zinc-binding dehydrogenase [Xylariaceae sp. FL0255]
MPHTLSIKKIEGKPGQVYYPLQLNEVPKPVPGCGEVLVKIHAAALNHRDFFVRQHLYPGIGFDSPLLCDGCGTVVELGPGCSSTAQSLLLNKTRSSTPCPWLKHGSRRTRGHQQVRCNRRHANRYSHGAAQEYVAVRESEVELCPEHLSPVEGAALPPCGLTGYRALVTKSRNAKPGRNVLITGIGGGVALQVLQLAVAKGCNVFVTSGSQAKIDVAISMSAVGGVSYKSEGWEKQLQKLLPADRGFLDTVIDGAGGDIIAKVSRLLKPGGTICNYGMTVAPKMDWSMQAVLKHIDLLGCTTGSRTEFKDLLQFVREHKIRPVISRTVTGLKSLDAIDELFQDMHQGKQFGKLVIEIELQTSQLYSKPWY